MPIQVKVDGGGITMKHKHRMVVGLGGNDGVASGRVQTGIKAKLRASALHQHAPGIAWLTPDSTGKATGWDRRELEHDLHGEGGRRDKALREEGLLGGANGARVDHLGAKGTRGAGNGAPMGPDV